MAEELSQGPFIRDDEDEGLFSRDIEGQLVRLDAPRADELVMAPHTGSPYSGTMCRESTQFGVKTCSLGGGLAPD